VSQSAERLLVLTERRLCERAGHSLPEVIDAAAQAGARRFVFREKDLEPAQRRALAEECLRAAGAHGATMAIASDLALARELGGLPVHLAAADTAPRSVDVVWGRSCHDEAEVERAVREGAAYITVSPVFASASKPGYGPPLGREGLRRLVEVAGALPVFALGGITPDTCDECIAAGASGVAVMSHIMSALRPAESVAPLMTVLAQPAATQANL
jgi:thiamine-phosphate pyrophosphorylase